MRKQKILLVIATLCLLVLAFSFNVSAQVNDGWVSHPDGTWSYYENGEMVCGQWRLDSKGWVYLDWNGIMVTNDFVYDSQGECYVDANGYCVTSAWVHDSRYSWEEPDWYYFDANGHIVEDDWAPDTYGWRYLDYNGKITYDRTIGGNIGDTWVMYYVKPNGYMASDEWIKDEYGNWRYYRTNGAAYREETALIGGKYYAFNSDGIMYTEGEHNIYLSASEKWVDIKVKADDSLVTSTWEKVYSNDYINGYYWQYYGSNGAKCAGEIALIGGKYYGFDHGGAMFDDATFSIGYYDYENEYHEWIYYRAKVGGELYVNTWFKTESGNWYYYGEGGKAPKGLVQMGDAYYYFDDYGRAACNETIEGLDGAAYYFDDECRGYKISGWFLRPNSDTWYYAFADGTLARGGIFTINGARYAFDYSGYMLSDTIYQNYLISEDGYIITADGWHTHGGWVYIKDGCVYEGWLELGNTWYYFGPYMSYCDIISDGNLLYATSVNGSYNPITAGGFYRHSNGYTVYVKDGKIVLDDWASIDGYWHYFDDRGAMVADSSYKIDGVLYYFDYNGRMASNGWVSSSYGTWYWAASNGALFTGLDNSGYVFSEYGYLLDEGVYEVNGRFFVVDADGKKVAELYNIGWNQVGNDWYYIGEYYDGEYRPYKDCSLEDTDGRLYYFDYDGKMLRNGRRSEHYFGADGAAVKGWVLDDGEWYYADEYNYLVSGVNNINGIEYYFDFYVLQTNVTTLHAGELISTNGDGAIVSRTDANGWIFENNNGYGTACYYENGVAFDGWKGDYFIEDGRMQCDSVVYSNGNNYYVGINGLCVYNQWIERKDYYGYGGYASTYDYPVGVEIESIWMLARADGSLISNDWYSNGVNWYYFDGVYMVSDCVIEIEGKFHKFDKNGIWLGEVGKTTSNNPDGWVMENGKWYFYMAGERAYGEIYYNGNWYRLGTNGEMVTNRFYYSYTEYMDGYYYYNADGIRLNATGWQKIDGKWTYFTKEHLAITGWINDGGVKYYQTNHLYDDKKFTVSICTGVQSIRGKLCYFDSEGVYQYDITGHGWYQVDDIWYYLDDGELVRSEYEYYIDGAYYAFDYDGWMYTDAIVDGRYYSESGQMVTASGWYIVNHKYIYIDSEGYVCRGVHVIDGKEYYFDGYYI